jgi:hypothetical protein
MNETLADLDVNKTYYVYTYMKYKYQTSNEYVVLGKRIEFTTTDNTHLSMDEKTTDDYKLTIYPNPSGPGNSVTLMLTMPENEKPNAIAHIFDITGKKVGEYWLTNFETQITLNVEKGVYVVRVTIISDKQLEEKIIIN